MQGTFSKPELDAGLKTALGANTATIAKLGGALDEADDITASATYSPSTARFGRSLAMHRGLIEAYMNAVAGEKDDPNAMLARVSGMLKGYSVDPQKPFSELPADLAAKVMAQVEAAALADKSRLERTSSLIAGFANLLNNQEQVYVSAVYHDRNHLAGADEWSIKATYELGGRNVSRFLNSAGARCATAAAIANEPSHLKPGETSCLQTFRDYVGTKEQPAVDRSWRVAVSTDLQQTQYLVDVNKKLNVHFGLSYKLPRLAP